MKLHILQDKVSPRRYLTLLKQKRVIPFLLMFAAFLLAYVLWPVMVLSITSEEGTVLLLPIDKEEEFSMIYTHSVEKTDVEDVFMMNQQKEMVLIRTEYESFGAGLPTESYGDFRKVGKRYINDGINEVIDSFNLRVGRVANHRIRDSKGNTIELIQHFEAGDSARIEIKKVSRFETWQY